jgi:hypothetical protein
VLSHPQFLVTSPPNPLSTCAERGNRGPHPLAPSPLAQRGGIVLVDICLDVVDGDVDLV